jgi:hypothetical protein
MAAIRMTQKAADHGPADFRIVRAPVQMARSQLCTWALEQGYDYLVMHDDDVEIAHDYPGNPMDTFVNAMEADPTIGLMGVVYLRQQPLTPTLVMYHPGYAQGMEHCSVVCGLPNHPFAVGGIGFGWVMIRCSAIRALLERNGGNDGPVVRFPHVKDVAGLTREIGEDYDVCDRLHELGYKVVADPRFETRHHKAAGVLHYRHDDWEQSHRTDEFPKLLEAEFGGVYVAQDGTRTELPPGRLEYQQNTVIDTPMGSQLIDINGCVCIDISAVRYKQRDDLAQAHQIKGAA